MRSWSVRNTISYRRENIIRQKGFLKSVQISPLVEEDLCWKLEFILQTLLMCDSAESWQPCPQLMLVSLIGRLLNRSSQDKCNCFHYDVDFKEEPNMEILSIISFSRFPFNKRGSFGWSVCAAVWACLNMYHHFTWALSVVNGNIPVKLKTFCAF